MCGASRPRAKRSGFAANADASTRVRSVWRGVCGDPAAGDWAGSLIRGQQDISGLMYRRNRYYDPQTSQFTQSDPIGIAGGLNTYGFANGDPVSYSDPYGLCPDHLWDEQTQTCPGGMTHDEYFRLEDLISFKMSAEAATPLLHMLENGRIIADQPMQGTETRIQAVHYRSSRPSDLRIGPTFWAEGTDAAAFTLSHDYAHVIQKERLGLIYDASSSMSLSQWNALVSNPTDGGAGQAFFDASQVDANRFACFMTIAETDYHARFCR